MKIATGDRVITHNSGLVVRVMDLIFWLKSKTPTRGWRFNYEAKVAY